MTIHMFSIKQMYIVLFYIAIFLVPFPFKHTANTKYDQEQIMHFVVWHWVEMTETAGHCTMVHTAQQTPQQQLCKSPLVTV